MKLEVIAKPLAPEGGACEVRQELPLDACWRCGLGDVEADMLPIPFGKTARDTFGDVLLGFQEGREGVKRHPPTRMHLPRGHFDFVLHAADLDVATAFQMHERSRLDALTQVRARIRARAASRVATNETGIPVANASAEPIIRTTPIEVTTYMRSPPRDRNAFIHANPALRTAAS